jgi:hypothetical protein
VEEERKCLKAKSKIWLRNFVVILGLMVFSSIISILILNTDKVIVEHFGPRYVEINREFYQHLTPHEEELVFDFEALQSKYERTVNLRDKRHYAEAMIGIANTLGNKIPPAKRDALKKIRKEYVINILTEDK